MKNHSRAGAAVFHQHKHSIFLFMLPSMHMTATQGHLCDTVLQVSPVAAQGRAATAL